MLPVIKPRSFALFRWTRRVQVDDIVLVEHPRFGRIIKSVRLVEKGVIELAGLSIDSVSSKALGQVTPSDIYGTLVWLSAPPRASV